MSRARHLISAWTPPAASRWAARRNPDRIVFAEADSTWVEAAASASGYGEASILNQVAAATRAVEAGDAAAERDGVLLHAVEPEWPLLVALLDRFVRDGRLSVLDFGGSLGSVYRTHRAYLDRLDDVRWNVVEQAAFVAAGNAEFANDRLRFYDDVDAVVAESSPNVVLLASTLQYLSAPLDLIAAVSRTPATTLIIDRTPMSEARDDTLCIQRVPPSIYPASYPMWVLSRPRLIATLSRDWHLDGEYVTAHPAQRTEHGLDFKWRGALLSR